MGAVSIPPPRETEGLCHAGVLRKGVTSTLAVLQADSSPGVSSTQQTAAGGAVRTATHGQSCPWATPATTPSPGEPNAGEAWRGMKQGSEGHKEVGSGRGPQPHQVCRDSLIVLDTTGSSACWESRSSVHGPGGRPALRVMWRLQVLHMSAPALDISLQVD